MDATTLNELTLIDAALRGWPIPDVPVDAFTDGRHRAAWGTIKDLYDSGAKVDLQVMVNRLQERHELDDAGGVSYYLDLDELPTKKENVTVYADSLIRDYQRRLAISFSEETSRLVAEGGDPIEIFEDFQAKLHGLTSAQRTKSTRIGDTLDDVLAEMDDNAANPTRPLGISTGIRPLDDLLGGINPGELLVIGARTGVGKTSLALTITLNAAKQGENCLFFSLEQPKREIQYKLLSAETDMLTKDLQRGNWTAEDRKNKILPAKTLLGGLNLSIDDRSALRDRDIIQEVRRLKPSLVVVDYIGLMRAATKRNERYLEVGSISASLKGLAKDARVPVILISQLNRNAEGRQNKRPILTDLRESDQIGQDADKVLLMYRKPTDDGTLSIETELILDKNRHGQEGFCKATFYGQTTTFVERY